MNMKSDNLNKLSEIESGLVPDDFIRLIEAAIKIKKHKTLSELAKSLKVSLQTLNNWKSRGVPKYLILKIYREWGVNSEWMETGQGSMISLEEKYKGFNITREDIEFFSMGDIPTELKENNKFHRYNPLVISGKEIMPNEIALINMYQKLSIDSKAMIDALCNQLYSLEHPNDVIATPFKDKKKQHKPRM